MNSEETCKLSRGYKLSPYSKHLFVSHFPSRRWPFVRLVLDIVKLVQKDAALAIDSVLITVNKLVSKRKKRVATAIESRST